MLGSPVHARSTSFSFIQYNNNDHALSIGTGTLYIN